MAAIEYERDFSYFKGIWEEKGKTEHSPEKWDERAKQWEHELSNNNEFVESLQERVNAATCFLQEKNILTKEQTIIDIGCGTGRFVTEFAKYAKHVVGLDISPSMIQLAENYAHQENFKNTEFWCDNFKTMDVNKLNLHKKFGLVFTSITPAISNYDCLEKLDFICNGYCFNSSFINWEDDIEDLIAQELLGEDAYPNRKNHLKWFYSLFNLLLLMGYQPEVRYHKQNRTEKLLLDDSSIQYYAREIGSKFKNEKEAEKAVLNLLSSHVDSEGYFYRNTKHWFAWTLWDVRDRRQALFQET